MRHKMPCFSMHPSILLVTRLTITIQQKALMFWGEGVQLDSNMHDGARAYIQKRMG